MCSVQWSAKTRDGDGAGSEPPFEALKDAIGAKKKRPRIRCPRCEWEPDGKPYWGCELCGAVFDTFATRAHCPECPNRWNYTWCPACDRVSEHERWYVDEGEA